MESLLTYILQVNLLLILIYVGYRFLLKSLTFYSLNRVYFVVGVLYALLYPLFDFKSWFIEDTNLPIPVLWDYISLEEIGQVSKTYSLYDFLLVGIAVGVILFVVKLIIQLFSLLRIHYFSKTSQWQKYLFRDVIFPIVPFSFFNKIYLHKAQHQETELQDIFEHESIHVKGRHTWDVLLFEILLITCWYNPFVWLMRIAVRQNLEFLTDQQVLNKGVDRQSYQYSLLHVTQRGAAVGISNQFNFKMLKKRIVMMNKKRSSRLELSKYAFLLPIVILVGASFTASKAEKKIDEVVDLAHEMKLLKQPKKVVDFFSNIDLNDVELKNYNYIIDNQDVTMSEFFDHPLQDGDGVQYTRNTDEIYNKNGLNNSKLLFILTTKDKLINSSKDNDATLPLVDTLSSTDNKYPLLAPNFDKKKLQQGNFYFTIDDNVVSLNDFLTFPRNEIGSVDIYKDKEEIQKKIGKVNADGLFVMTSKKSNSKDKAIPKVSVQGVTLINPIITQSKYDDSESNKKSITIMGHTGKVELKRNEKSDLAVNHSYEDTQNTDSRYSGKLIAINGFPIDAKKENVPLFVIDDVEKEKGFVLNKINPNEIESISVLKDASATSVYGDKGKYGVIIITSKKKKNDTDVKRDNE